MGFKTTGVLAVLFIALLGFFYFYEIKGGEERKEAEAEAKKVLQIDDKQVTRLTVQRRDTTVVVAKEGEGWRVLAPLKTEGDRANIESLLRTVNNLERVQVVADEAAVAGGAVDPGDFGLGERPDITVVLEQEGRRDTLFFGDKSPTGSYAYLRMSGSPEILAISSWRKSSFDKGLYDLREKRVMPFDRDAVRKIELSYDGQTIVMLKQGEEWQLEKPVAERGDSETIRRFLSRLWTARAKRFAAEEATDLAPYGLDNPWMRVSVYEGEGLALKEAIVGDAVRAGRINRYYVKYAAKSPILMVDSSFVVSMKKSLSDLRYKKIFAFDAGGIDRVTLVYPDSTVDCKRDTSGAVWTAVEPRFHIVSDENVAELIGEVQELEAKSFVAETLDAPEAYGLDVPAIQVKLWAAGRLVREVLVGKKGDEVYAKGDHRPQVVEVLNSILGKLKLDLIAVAPTATAEP